jgi:hypothetical protein
MFQSKKKKLVVAKETVRRLDEIQLRGVAGGQTKFQCSTICPDSDPAVCVQTFFNDGCNGPTVAC